MKWLLLIVVLSLFIIGCNKKEDDIKIQQPTQQNTETNKVAKVWICTGKYAKKYHKYILLILKKYLYSKS